MTNFRLPDEPRPGGCCGGGDQRASSEVTPSECGSPPGLSDRYPPPSRQRPIVDRVHGERARRACTESEHGIVLNMAWEATDGGDGLGSAQRAYQLIRSSIIEGRYRAGQRLIEGRIGEEFALSRTPVREALRLLEAEGLVLSIRNRGAIVRPVSPKEIIDLYELRARLESLGAERAAARATDAGIAELDAAITAFEAAIPSTDRIELTENRILSQANSRFHDAIVEMADHVRLSQLMARTVDIPLVFQAFRVFTREERVRSNVFHRLIRDALKNGEAARAGALMSEHILMGRDSLVARRNEAQVKDALFLGAPGESGR